MLGLLKLFLLLYADDIVIFSESEQGLQEGLNILEAYCDTWKLTVNVNKTKITVFRKGGRMARNMQFSYKLNEIEIVIKFTYLSIVFTTGGALNGTFDALSEQALTSLYKLERYLRNFTQLKVIHYCELFDKLVLPV